LLFPLNRKNPPFLIRSQGISDGMPFVMSMAGQLKGMDHENSM
jgi:hypothetical protein